MEEEKQRAIADARQAGTEAAIEALLGGSLRMSFSIYFHSTPKGGLESA